MVLITIVTGAYKPTYNRGASHCIKYLFHEGVPSVVDWNSSGCIKLLPCLCGNNLSHTVPDPHIYLYIYIFFHPACEDDLIYLGTWETLAEKCERVQNEL